ncbi:hypothetical protein OG749_08600 [Streptomyces nojiriensis]|uniref:hypothetical protein n=1 Tax=Streptomyces nojiriensis TaxID=66374 RepID=UPI002E188D29
MPGTVDYFICDCAEAGSNNLADTNCSFGKADIWPGRPLGSADYRCESPLRG